MTNERLEELRQFFLPDGYDALLPEVSLKCRELFAEIDRLRSELATAAENERARCLGILEDAYASYGSPTANRVVRNAMKRIKEVQP